MGIALQFSDFFNRSMTLRRGFIWLGLSLWFSLSLSAQQKETPGECKGQSTWIQLTGIMPEFEEAGITAEYIVNRDGTMEFRIDDGFGKKDGVTGPKVFRFTDPKKTTDPNSTQQQKQNSSNSAQPCMIQIMANADRSCNDRKQKPICDPKKFRSHQNDQLQLRGQTADKRGNTKSQVKANIQLEDNTFTFSLNQGNSKKKDEKPVPRLEVKMNDSGSLEVTRVYKETKNNKSEEKNFTIEIESIQRKKSQQNRSQGAQEINEDDLNDSSGITTCGVNSSIRHSSVGVEDLRQKAKTHLKAQKKKEGEKVKDDELNVDHLKMDALCQNAFVTGVNNTALSSKEIQNNRLVTGLESEEGGDKKDNEASKERNNKIFEQIAALQKAKNKNPQNNHRSERNFRQRHTPSNSTR